MSASSKQEVSRQKTSGRQCRFYDTQGGCRAGEHCAFVHDTTSASQTTHGLPAGVRGHVRAPRVVPKPVAAGQQANPREWQLGQIQRRFPGADRVRGTEDVICFRLKPSDPDFPYDLAHLECELEVPSNWPQDGLKSAPRLRVMNEATQLPVKHRANIERGFNNVLVKRMAPTGGTLLQLVNALDRHLEDFLMEEAAETVKIVANTRSEPKSVAPERVETVSEKKQQVQESERRQMEIRQLEARLGRQALFKRGDATQGGSAEFTVPLAPRRREELPVSLQAVPSVKLIVPWKYGGDDHENAAVEIQGIPCSAALSTERGFELWASDHHDATLVQQVNYLAQNMHVFATETSREEEEEEQDKPGPQEDAPVHASSSGEETKSHVQFIPRPPEWSVAEDDEESDGESESDSETSSDGSEGEEHGEKTSALIGHSPERGTALSFPSIEMYGIELLETSSLSLSLRCERCKTVQDVSDLRPGHGIRETCRKCASQLGAVFRRELMHANNVRAGYLDLEGCAAVDMLPSRFKPTCAECSTVLPEAVSLRGENTLSICRECHRRISFKIHDVKFLIISPGRQPSSIQRKKARENLGLVGGQELPRRGRCSHYAKSYRWFSCCSKVFPCDRCHDAATDHPNEHANRMICGYCSREQGYRPADCAICHSGVIGRKATGFWEGGKGTRDRTRMSRKDPRKYKRRIK